MITPELKTDIRPGRTPLYLKKSLGQHFLRDRDAAAKIAAAVPKGGLVVEIGPGDGALTQELFLAGHRVLAIEIDAEMIPLLKRRFHRQKDTFSLIVADVLTIDWRELAAREGPFVIAGNLPYNIATQIVMRSLETARGAATPPIKEMIVTVQKEVAERLTASPGGKAYGAMTLLAKYHTEPKYLFTIPAKDFFPKPQVDGGVIKLKYLTPDQLPNVDYYQFRRLVKGCFAQRRKVLSNAIRVVNNLPGGWHDIPIDWSRRPEQLSLDDFVELTRTLIKLGWESSAPETTDSTGETD